MWTLIDGFKHLSPEEFDILIDAPALITILVGGADGNLDQEERDWSERLLRSRTYNNPKELNEYYRIVSELFWAKVNGHLAELPRDPEARNEIIAERLKALNPIMAKLDIAIGADLYHGFIGLAEETAKASGGFLRIGAISPEEARWIHLPMLTPIITPKKNAKKQEDALEKDDWDESDKDA
jgi:hypothetical protein